MCTYFTLTYACSHTQTSHRCPRTTTTIYTPQGEPTTHIAGCDNKMYLGSSLAEPCIECKMKAGLMPGVQTGADRWAVWGPREEAIRKRQEERRREEAREVEARVEGRGEAVAGDAVVREEMGANNGVVREESRDPWMEGGYYMQGTQMQMPTMMPLMMETKAVAGKSDFDSNTNGGHVAGEHGKEPEDDDDWMYGGMKAFGGEAVSKGKGVAMGGEWEGGDEDEVWVGVERFTKRMG